MSKLKVDKLRSGLLRSQNKPDVTPLVNNGYVSHIDYSKYEDITAEEIEFLKSKEGELSHSRDQINKNLAVQSKLFYEIREKLSKDRLFKEWFTDLGYSKTYVYRVIDTYRLFIEYNSDRVFNLSTRVIAEMKKFDNEEVIEIINSDNPTKQIQILKKEKEELEKEKIEELEIIESLEFLTNNLSDKKEKLEEKIENYKEIKNSYIKIKDEIKELKDSISELKKKIKQKNSKN